MKKHKTFDHLAPSEKPDITKVIAELEQSVTDAGEFLMAVDLADRVKNCIWDGQSDDGKKHADAAGRDVLPWEGASDQRVRVAELLVSEEARLCKTALVAGRAQAVPINPGGDPTTAAAQIPMLTYQFRGQMLGEMRDEIDYILDWRGTYGHAVMGLCWHEERQLEEATLTVGQVLGAAVEQGIAEAGLPAPEDVEEAIQSGTAPPEEILAVVGDMKEVAESTGEALQELIFDVERLPQLVALLGTVDPLMPPSEARRVAKQFQDGETEVTYVRPFVKESRPKWEALQPWVDIFYPFHTKKLQDAQWLARVHWLSEPALRERAAAEGWDKRWVEEVCKKPGRWLEHQNLSWVLSGSDVRMKVKDSDLTDARLFQVVEFYRRAVAIGGIPAIYRTVIHQDGKGKDGYAIHEVLKEWNGRYPFKEFRRERKKKYLASSRGIPSIIATHQNAIKAQHDARTDRTNLIMNPPALVPGNRAGGRFDLGPYAQIPVRRSGTLEWMKPPEMDMDSIEITEEEWHFINLMFGRWDDRVPQPLSTMIQQDVVGDFLIDMSELCSATFDICWQWIDDAKWQEITGFPKPPLDRGKTNFSITYDVRDLNLEWLAQKGKMFAEFVIPNDSEAAIDRYELASHLFAAIDPVLAQRAIRPKQAMMQGEIEEEQHALALAAVGIEAPMKEGVNHALRLQLIQEAITASPKLQGLLKDEISGKILEARVKFHQFHIAQDENRIIGRTGAQPALEGGGA